MTSVIYIREFNTSQSKLAKSVEVFPFETVYRKLYPFLLGNCRSGYVPRPTVSCLVTKPTILRNFPKIKSLFIRPTIKNGIFFKDSWKFPLAVTQTCNETFLDSRKFSLPVTQTYNLNSKFPLCLWQKTSHHGLEKGGVSLQTMPGSNIRIY